MVLMAIQILILFVLMYLIFEVLIFFSFSLFLFFSFFWSRLHFIYIFSEWWLEKIWKKIYFCFLFDFHPFVDHLLMNWLNNLFWHFFNIFIFIIIFSIFYIYWEWIKKIRKYFLPIWNHNLFDLSNNIPFNQFFYLCLRESWVFDVIQMKKHWWMCTLYVIAIHFYPFYLVSCWFLIYE